MAAEAIYHEKQYGSMCGQHCLNNLVQAPIFSAMDLADIASELDALERHLLEPGEAGDASQSFNVDDSGNFSIQVLAAALERGYDLQLDQDATQLSKVLDDVNNERMNLQEGDVAFVCNLREHWFCIRSIRGEIWNLNSLKKRPELISLFYLSAYLGQLREEGYSIFTVLGKLPELLKDMDSMGKRSDWFVPGVDDAIPEDVPVKLDPNDVPDDDPEFKLALRASLASSQSGGLSTAAVGGNRHSMMADDDDLQTALALSLQEGVHLNGAEEEDFEEIVEDLDAEDDEEEQMRRAIKESMRHR